MSRPSKPTKAARLYAWSVPAVGIGLLVWALADLVANPPKPEWLALAGLTVLTGSFTVKIPGLVARLSVSEPFVFAAALVFGPSVGVVTAALDALIMSLWLLPGLKTAHRVAFNLGVLAISISLSARLFFFLTGLDPRHPSYSSLTTFIVPLYIFALTCFILNSGLIALALSFERDQSAIRIWREQFLWLSLNYFSGGSVAALIVVYARSIDLAVIGIIIPLLAISYLTFRTTLGRLADANTHLEQVNALFLSTIETLAMAVDAKDQVTHGHIRRVQRLATSLATILGVNDAAQTRSIEAAALLHDMGKLAIPEHILNKPGRLSQAEFEKMKQHAGIGADILSAIPFPYPVIPIVRHHHENWDGSGYPDGLVGTAIPIGARILSVVDCYDALTSDRPYRPRMSQEDATSIIVQRRGQMYDPLVVDTFVEHLNALTESLSDVGLQSETLQAIASLNYSSSAGSVRPNHLVQQPLAASAWPSLPAASAEDTLWLLFARLRLHMSIDLCVAYLPSACGTNITASAEAGPIHLGLLGSSVPVGGGIAGWVAAHKQSIRNAIPELDLGNLATDAELRSAMVVPALDLNCVVAVLGFYSKRSNAYSTTDEELVSRWSHSIVQTLRERDVHVNSKGSSMPLAHVAR